MLRHLFYKNAVPTLIPEGTHLHGQFQFFSDVEIFGVVEGEILCQDSVDRIHIGLSGCVQGDIKAEGEIVIEGRVDGDITSSKNVDLLGSAIVTGAIHAPTISVRPGAFVFGTLKVSTENADSQPHRQAA